MRRHYTRIVDGYIDGLVAAKAAGEVHPELDPEVAAWALMGFGEMIGMRWILWEGSDGEVPDEILDQMTRFIQRGLGARANSQSGQDHS